MKCPKCGSEDYHLVDGLYVDEREPFMHCPDCHHEEKVKPFTICPECGRKACICSSDGEE